MAIQLRRGNEADLDISQLKPGEAAVCLDSGRMIVKLNGGNYLTLTDTDAIQQILDGKAPASHEHQIADITDLATALAGKAAADHNHSGVYAPASHSHVQEDISGLIDALARKAASDHSHRTILNSNAVNIRASNNELDLGVNVLNYEAVEIRFVQYSHGSTNYYTTLRVANSGNSYGIIPAVKYVYNTGTGVPDVYICRLDLSGTKLTLADDGNMPSTYSFHVSTVIGYK